MAGRRLRRLSTVVSMAIALSSGAMASAERIASRDDSAAAAPAVELAQVRTALAHPEVAKALEAQGLSPTEVEQRLARLSAEDLQRLSANLEQVQAAGNVPNYVWILLAAFLAVSTLAIIF